MIMAVHYRSQGFVFKKNEKGESDQIIFVFTKEFGKLNILGKAIRKNASKLRGGAELFCLSDIEFIQGKSQKTLTDAVLIDNFLGIKKSLKKTRLTYQVIDILDSLTVNEEKDEKIWQLLNEVFCKLNDWKVENSLNIIYYYFFWNLASVLGYHPELTENSIGEKKINSDIAKILKIILKKDWPILSRLKIESSHYELLKNISEWYNEEKIESFSQILNEFQVKKAIL